MRDLELCSLILKEQAVTLRRRRGNGLWLADIAIEHDVPAPNAHCGEVLGDGSADFIKAHRRRHGGAEPLQNVFLLFKHKPSIRLGAL